MQPESWETTQIHSNRGSSSSWLPGSNLLTRIMEFSLFASMFQSHSPMVDTVKLFLLGTIIQSGRRFFQWLIERFKFRQYSDIPSTYSSVYWPVTTRILHNSTIHWRRSCLWVDHSFSCMSWLIPSKLASDLLILDTRKPLEAISWISRNIIVFSQEMERQTQWLYSITNYKQCSSWIRSNIRSTTTFSLEWILGGKQTSQRPCSSCLHSRVWASIIS